MAKFNVWVVLLPLVSSLLAGCGRAKHTVAGTIRFENGRWSLVEDDEHRSEGIKRVHTLADLSAQVDFDFKAETVLTFIASPDEAYASLGYTTGASVGLDNATIHIGSGTNSLDEQALSEENSNIWIYGILE